MILRKFNQDSKDIIFLLKLKNKNYVRKNSFDKNIIKIKDHLIWLKKRIKKIEIFIFGKNKTISYGYIYREKKEGKIYLSWAILKKYNSKNYTTIALKKCSVHKQKYFAEIKINNIPSQIVALKAGFKIQKVFKNYILLKK